MHSERLHIISRLPVLIHQRLVEGGHGKRWHCDFLHLRVREEDMPPRGMISREKWRISQRRQQWLFVVDAGWCFTVEHLGLLTSAGGIAPKESVEIAFFGVGVFEVGFDDWGYVEASGRDDSSFYDELDQR